VTGEYLNTLYVTRDAASVRLDHDTLRVDAEGDCLLHMPLLHLGCLIVFGNVYVTPALMRRFAEDGKPIVYLSRAGRFVARVEGPVSGNVLLRQSQYRAMDDAAATAMLARSFVAGKIQNSRGFLQRSSRDADAKRRQALRPAIESLGDALARVDACSDLNTIRGVEGECARKVFNVFGALLTKQRDEFEMSGRTRRPPLDRTNALLSFLYALLASDCSAALEAVGLDPQAGYLHALRPGRPALTLDLMEELRPVLGDRLAVTLVNRCQIAPDDFATRPGGAVWLNDEGRKKVLVAYQTRKADEVSHRMLKRKVPLGLVPHLQARLLARVLRGDIEAYPAFRME
jgi:CRISP-associated protein Cas1